MTLDLGAQGAAGAVAMVRGSKADQPEPASTQQTQAGLEAVQLIEIGQHHPDTIVQAVVKGARPLMHDLADMAIRVNDFMAGLFAGVGIRLVDFKLEFGRLFDGEFSRIILADEISPDTCRLWDMNTNEKLDKDRFRLKMGGVKEGYQEVARRLGVLPRMQGKTADRAAEASAEEKE